MSTPDEEERRQHFLKAVDISIEVLPGAPYAERQVQFGRLMQSMARGEMPGAPPSMAGLRSLEHAFFTAWNEGSGPHVDEFWRRIAAHGLPYQRTDVLATVLARGRIVGRGEYETVNDLIVVAQQEGRITGDQANRLNAMLGEWELSGDEDE